MASAKFPLDRRTLITGLAAAALSPALPAGGPAQPRPSLALTVAASRLALRPGGPETPVWALTGLDHPSKRGEQVEISVGNELPAPVALHWRGVDGAPAAEPLLLRAPLAARSREAFQLPLRHAGTFLCDPGLLGDGQACPFRAMPLIVLESETVAVDRDVMLVIEEWRLRPDGIAIAPGVDPKDATPLYTLNGKPSFELSAAANERLRLRIINASQRSVLAIKLEGHEVRVMAIDGEPAEPFSARNGAVVLAPGGRTDAFIDAASAASILLHDGKQARPIGKLNVSGAPVRPSPIPPAPPLPFQRPAGPARAEERPAG